MQQRRAPVGVDLIHARRLEPARRRQAFVRLQLTVVTMETGVTVAAERRHVIDARAVDARHRHTVVDVLITVKT